MPRGSLTHSTHGASHLALARACDTADEPLLDDITHKKLIAIRAASTQPAGLHSIHYQAQQLHHTPCKSSYSLMFESEKARHTSRCILLILPPTKNPRATERSYQVILLSFSLAGPVVPKVSRSPLQKMFKSQVFSCA